MRPRLFYWEKTGNSIAEVDYLSIRSMKVLPIEIKAGTQGGMKSLWIFMREKHLDNAVRCSLDAIKTMTTEYPIVTVVPLLLSQ